MHVCIYYHVTDLELRSYVLSVLMACMCLILFRGSGYILVHLGSCRTRSMKNPRGT